MVHICVHGCSMDVLVTVPSMDTGMWEKVDVHTYIYIYILYGMCPTGRPSYCAIHGYCGMWEKVDVHSYIYIYIYTLYGMCPTMNYTQADTSSAMYVLHIRRYCRFSTMYVTFQNSP